MTTPRLVPAALDLIRHFEGLKLTSYRDGAGLWTIGYGHRRNAAPGMTITVEHAEQLLEADAGNAALAVGNLTYTGTPPLPIVLGDPQFAALTDFVFNAGACALGGSTLLALIKAGKFLEAGNEFPRWVHDHRGNVEPGLITRRAAEQQLWLA